MRNTSENELLTDISELIGACPRPLHGQFFVREVEGVEFGLAVCAIRRFPAPLPVVTCTIGSVRAQDSKKRLLSQKRCHEAPSCRALLESALAPQLSRPARALNRSFSKEDRSPNRQLNCTFILLLTTTPAPQLNQENESWPVRMIDVNILGVAPHYRELSRELAPKVFSPTYRSLIL